MRARILGRGAALAMWIRYQSAVASVLVRVGTPYLAPRGVQLTLMALGALPKRIDTIRSARVGRERLGKLVTLAARAAVGASIRVHSSFTRTAKSAMLLSVCRCIIFPSFLANIRRFV